MHVCMYGMLRELCICVEIESERQDNYYLSLVIMAGISLTDLRFNETFTIARVASIFSFSFLSDLRELC